MPTKIKYCENTGKPHTKIFDDGLDVGIHRRGSQVTLPLNTEGLSIICKYNNLEIVFKDETKIDLLIERLKELKVLKEQYSSH